MATLAEYESALDACVAAPTAQLAAKAANKHALLPTEVRSGDILVKRPELPEWIKNLAAIYSAGTDDAEGGRIIHGRLSYGDGR